MEKTQFNKIVSLQFLRAFACLSVLFTHVLQLLNIKPFGDYFVSGGYGVDLFFVLSGFLIYLTTKNNDNWESFALKRLLRIFPLYWFCLILFVIWEIIFFKKEYTLVYYMQNLLMMPWNNSLTPKSLIVGVAWSTVYEMYFYSAFTILLILKFRKKYIIGLLVLLLAIFRAVYITNIFDLKDNSTFLFSYSVVAYYHIVPFILGILVAIFFQKPIVVSFLQNLKFKKILFVTVHLLYFFILLNHYNPIISHPITVFIFILWLKIDLIWKVNYDSLMSRFFVKIGDISFSIYLIHMLVLSIIIDYFAVTNVFLVTFFAYLVTIVMSLITYKYIETPFINLSKKFVDARRRKISFRETVA